MVSQQVVITVVLPIAAMSVIIASVASIQDSTLTSGLGFIGEETSFGYPEVTVSEETELRGLTVFNMLSAQNCLYAAQVYHRRERLEENTGIEDSIFGDIDKDYEPLKLKSGHDGTVSELPESTFTYFGHGDVLSQALELDGFNGVCLGGKEISITETLREHNKYLDDVLSAYETAKSLAPWNIAEGESADKEALNRGALQGRFGRIEFETNDTLHINDPRLMGLKLNERVTNSGFAADEAPDFIRGSRAAVFLPEGFLRDKSSENLWAENEPGRLKEDILGMTAYAGGAVTGGTVGAGLAYGVTAVVTGGASIIVTGVLTVTGGAFGGYFGAKTAKTYISDELDIGSHPAILIGIDQKEDAGNDDWYGDDTGLYDYADPENSPLEEDVSGWRENINAFRVRMVNVPTVMSPVFSTSDAKEMNDASLQLGYNYIAKQSTYVICNGSQGFIQSNAGAEIEYDGKKRYQDDSPIYRDVVYPRVEVSKHDVSCMADAAVPEEYHETGPFKPATEFMDDEGEFKGPISESVKHLPNMPLNEMRNGDEYETATLEDAVLLDPETKVDLTQGITRLNVDELDISWWDKRSPVYELSYAVKPDKCGRYQDSYDVTRVFSDNAESNLFIGVSSWLKGAAERLIEDYEAEDSDQDNSYEVIEEEGDYKIQMRSDTGLGALSPLHYPIDRFSADEVTMDFKINIEGVESTDNEGYQLIGNEELEGNLINIRLRSDRAPGSYYYVKVRKDTALKGLVYKNDPNSEDIDRQEKEIVNLKKLRESYGNSDSDHPPAERDYTLVVDKESDGNGRIQLLAEFGNEYRPVFTEFFSGEDLEPEQDGAIEETIVSTFGPDFIDVNDIDSMKPAVYTIPSLINNAPATLVTIDEVNVEGTVTGCPLEKEDYISQRGLTR